jgi:NADH:ubiquinone oxidoreductase subunit F (NADH-binding)
MTNHAVVTITPSGKWEASSRGNAFGTQPGTQNMSAMHAASLLKNRRRKHSSAMKRGRGGAGGGTGGKLSLMTAFEGESSMMDSEHHLVGCLSDAQHVGGFY